jgi:hypothetical protein
VYRLTGSRSTRWTCRTRHTCSGRIATAARLDIEPEHAIEAVFDPRRLVARDPKSRTGEAIRVVGYSAGMDRVLVVVLVPDHHPPGGLWHIATAWPADSRRMRRIYGGGKESEDG